MRPWLWLAAAATCAVLAPLVHRRHSVVSASKPWLHNLDSAKVRTRMTNARRDFLDHAIMLALCVATARMLFGRSSSSTAAGDDGDSGRTDGGGDGDGDAADARVVVTATTVISAFMLLAFALRHGVELSVPVLVQRPLEAVRCLLYKLENLRFPVVLCAGTRCLEQAVIQMTPTWEHHSEWCVRLCASQTGDVLFMNTTCLAARSLERRVGWEQW